jgi:putative flippase GtrA
MQEEAQSVDLGLHVRVRHGLRRPHNWFQLGRFGAVGASGYVVNLAVFVLCLQGLGLHYLLAGTAAFLVAVTNNFLLNRHWTFRARDGHAGFQAARFLSVSVAAFVLNLVALHLLIDLAGWPKVLSQAVAIACATPLNFIGNKLWSFRI